MFIILLFYFILGILFSIVISPLLDIVVEIISTKAERIKAKEAVEIAKMNTQISKIQNSLEDEGPVRVIGFQSDPIEEDDDYDDDDE